jgi:hypothetical protein
MNCKCENWARADVQYAGLKSGNGMPLITNHHPTCQHYNDSLIPIFLCHGEGGVICYCASRKEAEEFNKTTEPIKEIKMHREIFEQLKEVDNEL